jgi:hypothetical protein
MSFEVIKRTELANGLVVMTAGRADAFCIRPYAAFSLRPASKFAQRLADFATEAAALHQHETLAERLRVKSSPGKQNELHQLSGK